MPELTPMKKQYLEIKAQHPDCLLFFRLGDFYEMFDEDAKVAAEELNLTLTTRDRNKPLEERTPMCGVPYHSAEAYIARLIAKGYKVAICEQTEDPAQAKGLVNREVIRVVTPGTLIEENLLEEGKNNFLAALCATPAGAGLCFGDISTGEVVPHLLPGGGVGQPGGERAGPVCPPGGPPLPRGGEPGPGGLWEKQAGLPDRAGRGGGLRPGPGLGAGPPAVHPGAGPGAPGGGARHPGGRGPAGLPLRHPEDRPVLPPHPAVLRHRPVPGAGPGGPAEPGTG